MKTAQTYIATYRLLVAGRPYGPMLHRQFEALGDVAADARAQRIAQEQSLFLLDVEPLCSAGHWP
jgi:hypothetical protein